MIAAVPRPAGTALECVACGLGHDLKNASYPGHLACLRCGSDLERPTDRGLDGALACSLATLILLVPANFLPFLETSLAGTARASWLVSSATVMWGDGWSLLGLAIGLFVVVAPLLRFGMLTLVLGSLRLDIRSAWQGPVFRWAMVLDDWAMADVFLLALWVAYARLHAAVAVSLEAGGLCFIAAGILTLFVRAMVSPQTVWETIRPVPLDCPGLACSVCAFADPCVIEGEACGRCRAPVTRRKRGAMDYAAALTAGGCILYILANIYPMATMPIGLTSSSYTVLEGAIDLLHARLYPLALLVLTASFAVPLGKLASLGWCITSVARGSRRRLRQKTGVYKLVAKVGRWSMLDPFVIAIFVPVMRYNSVITARADGAATAFAAVVVATMIAADRFDPRLLWDERTGA